MRVTVTPGIPQGTVRVPTSKSVAHRYLIAAAFTPGETRLRDLPDNADIRATLRCLRAMGAAIRQDGTGATICGRVPGGFPPDAVADCGESGTTLRLLLPFALLQPAGARMTFTGAPRLFARPLSVYEDICRAQGVLFARTEAGVTVGGGLHPDAFCFPGDISSQFVSGLLLALPHLRGDSSLRLTGQVGSASYIGLTLDALRLFGYTVGADGVQAYRIPGGQTGRAPEQALCVPTDQSAAAFFGAMRTLGGDISLADFRDDGAQGDRVFGAYMERLCREKCRLSVADCPDLAPILLVVAALHHGGTLCDTARLRFKESDRGEAMAAELRRCGVRITVGENEITVEPGIHAPDGALCAHNDHRVAMSLAVLLCRTGGSIDGAECVAKSMPEFFDTLRSLGIAVRTEGEI